MIKTQFKKICFVKDVIVLAKDVMGKKEMIASPVKKDIKEVKKVSARKR